MSTIPSRTATTRALTLLAVIVSLGGAGCATQTLQVTTARYTITYPDHWELKQTGTDDGKPTIMMVTRFGDADVDDASLTSDRSRGAMRGESTSASRLADVEIHVYAWPGGNEPVANISRVVADKLLDANLDLRGHGVVSEQPPECKMLHKRYKILGADQEPLNLAMKPKWRTIVVGGQGMGNLVAVAARVPWDNARYCENLSNMRVNLQHFLDALHPVAVPVAHGQAIPVAPLPSATPGTGDQPGPGSQSPPASDGNPQTTTPLSPQE